MWSSSHISFKRMCDLFHKTSLTPWVPPRNEKCPGQKTKQLHKFRWCFPSDCGFSVSPAGQLGLCWLSITICAHCEALLKGTSTLGIPFASCESDGKVLSLLHYCYHQLSGYEPRAGRNSWKETFCCLCICSHSGCKTDAVKREMGALMSKDGRGGKGLAVLILSLSWLQTLHVLVEFLQPLWHSETVRWFGQVFTKTEFEA